MHETVLDLDRYICGHSSGFTLQGLPILTRISQKPKRSHAGALIILTWVRSTSYIRAFTNLA